MVRSRRLSRRRFLGAAGGLVSGAALGSATSGMARTLAAAGSSTSGPGQLDGSVPFYGRHQAGVTTPQQRFSLFATFDVCTVVRKELARMLQRWTEVAAELCAGGSVGIRQDRPDAVAPDSGSTVGLGPARLSVNFGLGPSLFGVGGPDRFGLRPSWPLALVELPPFPGDQIAHRDAGGDLTVHACADDPQVVFHALQQITRAAAGRAAIRWTQSGFNEAAVTAGTPRDLLGFKDGTINPRTTGELEEFVWVGEGQDQAWMRDGTYLVVRRIRLLLDRWDAQTLGAQERVIGRRKWSGAPLGKEEEFDALDLDRRTDDGRLVIPSDAHVRLAAPSENWAQMLLRRSYGFSDGAMHVDGESGTGARASSLDAGLLFCAYQQDPRLAFIPIYGKLATRDALRQFTVHTASAVAAIPPGAPGPGHWVGEGLLG